MRQVDVLGYPFYADTAPALIDELQDRLDMQEKTFLVTANPEIIMNANQNPNFRSLIMEADRILPDGVGIVIGSRILRNSVAERITGYDLMMDLLAIAERKNYSVYFLGTSEPRIKLAAENLQQQYPMLKIAGYHHGYIDTRDEALAREIAAVKPDMIFVGLGSPKQEEWIARHLPLFEKGLFMGIGGCFDIAAGHLKRAPEAWQRLKVEWLYRLIQQPSRWRRMIVLPKFLGKVLLHRFKKS